MNFFDNFKNKKTTVAGLGKSGISALNLLHSKGFNVCGCDIDETIINKEEIKKLSKKNIEIFTGKDFDKQIAKSDLVILSPGIDQRSRIYEEAKAQNNAVVTGELELAWSYINKPVIAVTGTNGKSTVTELTAEIFSLDNKRVFKGGNLGTPLSDAVLNQDDYDIMVIEVSSFQIDTSINFAPDIAVLLNITPDHLDRYDGFEGYKKSKLNIFKNMNSSHCAVLNINDNIKINHSIKKIWFNKYLEDQNSASAENGYLKININNIKQDFNLSRFKPEGRHNLENLSAAASAAFEAGATPEGLKKAIECFKGLPHRMEYCKTVGKTKFINDSKATNPDSVLKALEGLDGVISLIMGGKDKGYDYAMLEQIINKKVENLILIGETKEKIKREVNFKGNTIFAKSMEDAVNKAFDNIKDNGTVLFSPACSSFDMFKNYMHRGEVFKDCVQKLQDKSHE
ncbi:MAG: UDP-N-acetylmuramoyl-L-alanine--D-glutamate ligase [Thermodesulfobacteriota bacterium]